MKQKLSALLSLVMLCALCAVPAHALEYRVEAPADYLFAQATSDATIYEWENPNVDRSKASALIPPGFGTPTSYLPNSGEYLTPNLAAVAFDGKTVNQVGISGTTVGTLGNTFAVPRIGSNTDSYGYPIISTGGVTAQQAPAFTQVTRDFYFANGSLGTIKIPSIGLTVGIYEGTTSAAMSKGAGHFEGTSIWNGNCCFAGHNRGVRNDFGKLHTLKNGATITLKVVETKETDAAGTITVSNVSEGYFEFREVSAPAGYDCDHTPVGVHVNAEDLQGEQTITVEKVNHDKRSLTIQKRDAEPGKAVVGTSFHIRGVNLAYENDVVTGADGKVVLSEMASGCYEVTETAVPSPYVLDSNNRKAVWIDASQGKDIVVDFVNATRPGLRLVKTDYESGKPIKGVTFKVEQVDGGYSAQHRTDKDGLIVLDGLTPGAYVVTEVAPAAGYVADPIPRTVLLEANKTTTVEIANVRRPDLRILKYDQQTKKPLSNVTFEVYHDAKLIGQ